MLSRKRIGQETNKKILLSKADSGFLIRPVFCRPMKAESLHFDRVQSVSLSAPNRNRGVTRAADREFELGRDAISVGSASSQEQRTDEPICEQTCTVSKLSGEDTISTRTLAAQGCEGVVTSAKP